jgi:hypothetical protein
VEDETSEFHSKGMLFMLLQGGYLNVSADCSPVLWKRDMLLMSTLTMHIGLEVLTVVVMKGTVFWNIMPCSPLKINFSEENIASIFRAKEKAEQNARMKADGKQSCFHSGT